MKYTLNKIKVALESYRHYWRGTPKIGKTTLFRDLILEAYGNPEYGLLIGTGNETGYKSLDNLYAIEAENWSTFVDTVTDLVENKKDNAFKLIAIDTVDELVSIATDRVLKIHFQRKNEKVDTLNAALGGYGAGHAMVCDIINDQIKRLESAGYGLVFIGHTKVRTIKEKGAGDDDSGDYMRLTGNLDSRFDGIFTNKADILAMFCNERNVENKKVLSSERVIYFRDNNFVDAGGRFTGMPECVPMTPKEYIKAFEQGVRASSSTPITDQQFQEMKKLEVEQHEKSANEYVEKAKEIVIEGSETKPLETVEDLRSAIKEELKKLNKESQAQKQAELKEKNIPTSFGKVEDVEVLKQILKVLVS